MTCPPNNFPKGLVCAGSTISVISERDALTGFPLSFSGPFSAPTADGLRIMPSPFLAMDDLNFVLWTSIFCIF
jgi:hypothetical protein